MHTKLKSWAEFFQHELEEMKLPMMMSYEGAIYGKLPDIMSFNWDFFSACDELA